MRNPLSVYPSLSPDAFELASRLGCRFRLWLPGVARGNAAGDLGLTTVGGAGGTIDTGRAETTWRCYAATTSDSTSRNRTFFANQTGDITIQGRPPPRRHA